MDTAAPTLDPRTVGATEHTHMLIAGAPGTGKTALAQAIAHDAAAAGATVTVVDPYGHSSYDFIAGRGPAPATTRHGAVEALRGASNEMNRRQAQMAKAGVAHFTELDEPPAPILLVLEEPTAWRSETVRSLIGRLVRSGRASGINVLVIVQDPSISQLAPELKSGLGTRVLMGAPTGPLLARQTLRCPEVAPVLDILCNVGAGVWEYSGQPAAAFQGPFETQETYRASLDRLRPV